MYPKISENSFNPVLFRKSSATLLKPYISPLSPGITLNQPLYCVHANSGDSNPLPDFTTLRERTIVATSVQNTNVFQTFYSNVSDRLLGLGSAFPCEVMANVSMNKAFKDPSQSLLKNWSDSIEIFRLNFLKSFSSTFLEFLVHRGVKVGGALTVQDIFADYDPALKRVLKSTMIYFLEIMIAPVHSLMILTTTGDLSIKGALKHMVTTSDGRFSARQPWAGATAFALKGLTFSPAQFEAWDFSEKLFGKKCKDMNTKEQVFTYALGAFCGSIVSMPSTRLYYNSAVRIKNPPTNLKAFNHFIRNSIHLNFNQTKQFMMEWQTLFKSAYIKNAVLNKTLWKSVSHVLMHVK
ncbi:MAG: hypothetical protein VW397_03695 [Candidatus Margulisiibacteriota bacterium]